MTNSEQQHEQHADGIVEAGEKAPGYFYVLYFGLIIWAVIFMAYYLLSGWSSDAEFEQKMADHSSTYMTTTAPASKAVSASDSTAAVPGTIDPASLFAAYCAACHAEDGTGGFGSDLTAATFSYGRNSDAVKISIAEGRGETMPPFGGQLANNEIDALVDFLLQF